MKKREFKKNFYSIRMNISSRRVFFVKKIFLRFRYLFHSFFKTLEFFFKVSSIIFFLFEQNRYHYVPFYKFKLKKNNKFSPGISDYLKMNLFFNKNIIKRNEKFLWSLFFFFNHSDNLEVKKTKKSYFRQKNHTPIPRKCFVLSSINQCLEVCLNYFNNQTKNFFLTGCPKFLFFLALIHSSKYRLWWILKTIEAINSQVEELTIQINPEISQILLTTTHYLKYFFSHVDLREYTFSNWLMVTFQKIFSSPLKHTGFFGLSVFVQKRLSPRVWLLIKTLFYKKSFLKKPVLGLLKEKKFFPISKSLENIFNGFEYKIKNYKKKFSTNQLRKKLTARSWLNNLSTSFNDKENSIRKNSPPHESTENGLPNQHFLILNDNKHSSVLTNNLVFLGFFWSLYIRKLFPKKKIFAYFKKKNVLNLKNINLPSFLQGFRFWLGVLVNFKIFFKENILVFLLYVNEYFFNITDKKTFFICSEKNILFFQQFFQILLERRVAINFYPVQKSMKKNVFIYFPPLFESVVWNFYKNVGSKIIACINWRTGRVNKEKKREMPVHFLLRNFSKIKKKNSLSFLEPFSTFQISENKTPKATKSDQQLGFLMKIKKLWNFFLELRTFTLGEYQNENEFDFLTETRRMEKKILDFLFVKDFFYSDFFKKKKKNRRKKKIEIWKNKVHPQKANLFSNIHFFGITFLFFQVYNNCINTLKFSDRFSTNITINYFFDYHFSIRIQRLTCTPFTFKVRLLRFGKNLIFNKNSNQTKYKNLEFYQEKMILFKKENLYKIIFLFSVTGFFFLKNCSEMPEINNSLSVSKSSFKPNFSSNYFYLKVEAEKLMEKHFEKKGIIKLVKSLFVSNFTHLKKYVNCFSLDKANFSSCLIEKKAFFYWENGDVKSSSLRPVMMDLSKFKNFFCFEFYQSKQSAVF